MRIVTGVMLAVFSALPLRAQEVSTELYGEFRYSYNRADAGEESHWASANNASRLGVRGTVTEGRLTGFVDLQLQVGIDEPNAFDRRHFFAGLRGPFGAVTIGRISPAYKLAGVRMDPFFDLSSISSLGGVPVTGLFAASSFGLSGLTQSFADRAISYVTPSLAGFSATGEVYVDPASNHDYAAGANYRAHGFDGGVHFYQADGASNWNIIAGPSGTVAHALRGHLGYTRGGRWSLAAQAERLESEAGPSQEFYYASGTVSPIRRLTLAAAAGHVSDSGAIQPVTGAALHGGVVYEILPQTRINAVYSFLDADDLPARSNAALGLTYAFVLRP